MRESLRSVLVWACCLSSTLVSGCLGGDERGYPLYTPADPRLPPERVATLHGQVASVDGERVPKTASFELEPGCHVVGLRTDWGGGDQSGAVMAHLPPLQYAMPMKATYQYVIEVRLRGTGNARELEILATERDASGNVTREFEPLSSQEQLDACQNASF